MKNIILDIENFEKKFNVKIKRNTTSLGLDTATRTGVAFLKVNTNKMYFDCSFFAVDIKNIDGDKHAKNRYRYPIFYNYFKNLINNTVNKVMIEDVFYGKNASVTTLLARIGMAAYCAAVEKGINTKDIHWLFAKDARYNISLPCIKKKQEVMSIFKERTKIKIENNDIIDAMVLAINGALE